MTPVRHVREVLQKGAEETGGAELDGKAQTAMVAAMGVDEPAITVVQVEIAGQLFRAEFSGEAAVAVPLLFGQETDGHGPPPSRGRHLQNLQVLRGNREYRISAEFRLQKYPAKGSLNARTFAKQEEVRH